MLTEQDAEAALRDITQAGNGPSGSGEWQTIIRETVENSHLKLKIGVL